MAIDAVVFDVDGVLASSAQLHERAWTALFDEYLPSDCAPFGPADYRRLVDGRTRRDGLVATLRDRGLIDDSTPSAEVIDRLAERKQQLFRTLLGTEGIGAFDDVVPFLDALSEAGCRAVAASASKNARDVLERAQLTDQFERLVDGERAASGGLASKPAPDLFIDAAQQLGLPPARCAVVEDSLSGVQAGRAGGFGVVIGIDRDSTRRGDLEEVADLVVGSLAEIDVELLRDGLIGTTRPLFGTPGAF